MNAKDEKMATAPVGKLMLSMGVPMILSMVLQAVYNIVDSAFVSNMAAGGEDALNALTLAFPLQVLMVAVGIGTGVGANVLIAKSLGQGDRELTNQTAGNAVFLGAVIYALFLLFGLLGVEAYIHSQTDNPVISAMGTDYLRICCVFSFGMSMFTIFEKMLQATGHSLCSTIAQVLGAVTNIVLDPILIYGWLGCPELGVKGAAYATVIGQVVSFLAALVFHLKFNRSIQLKPVHLKPSLRIIGMIYSIGLPAVIMLAGCVVLEAFAVPFAALFGLSGTTQALCVSAIRIISAGLVFAGINIAFQGVLQAVGSGLGSLIISVCRQLLFVFPLALIFAPIAVQDPQLSWLLWSVFPIAELLTAAAAVLLWRNVSAP